MKVSDLQPRLFKRFSHVLQADRLHHAFLFSGGFGAMDMALWLTQSRFCHQLRDGLPCGKCRECRLVLENDFTDLHIVRPEGQTIKTQQIRELLVTFSQSGFEGSRQVVIIDGAEKLHVNAANALLKSIEEPESEIYIFLLTASENMALDTIKSRTQVINFPSQPLLIQKVLEQDGVLKTDAMIISKIVASIADAQSLAQDSQFLDSSKQVEKFVRLLIDHRSDAFLQAASLASCFKDKKSQALAFKMLAIFLTKASQPKLVELVFTAQKYWHANVNFQSCLEKISLD